MTLEHLLAFRETEFVQAAYRSVLCREPDVAGLEYHLGQLRRGALSKLDILISLRFSDEGRQAGVHIPGLTRAYWTHRIKKLPLVGHLLQIGYGIWRLPTLLNNTATREAYIDFQFSDVRRIQSQVGDLRQEFLTLRAATPSTATVVELQHHLARLEFAKANRKELAILDERVNLELSLRAGQDEVTALTQQIGTRAGQEELAALAQQVGTRAGQEELAALAELVRTKAGQEEVAALAGQQRAVEVSIADRAQLQEIESRITQCESHRVDPNSVARIGDDQRALANQIVSCRQDLQDQHYRLSILLELARKRMPEPFTPKQLTALISEESHLLDSLYVAFEDRFRGSRAAVLDGTKVYLPYIQKVMKKGNDSAPLLDVACGRGEWLELLRANGYCAKGVDVNRAALQQCKNFGLDVVEDDAIEYLRKQSNNTFSMVTCFHYVEHIDYRSLIALLDEALRVLIPGGMAIFETPNARNILVTSSDFYRDPTHKHPVFPETLECLAELRGFAESTAYCFNDTRTELIPLSTYSFSDLNAYTNVSRDLAWIGVKSQ